MTISRQQCIDTGLAAILILLLFKQVMPAIVVVLLAMVFPKVLKPLAMLWFGLSHILGMIMPRVILSLIFIVILCPIGLMLRIFKPNMMNKRAFKSGDDSLYIEKNTMYQASDLANQF